MIRAVLQRVLENSPWLDTPYASIPLWQILTAIGLVALSILLKRFFERVFMKWLLRFLGHSPFHYDTHILEALGKPLAAFVMVSGFFLGVHILIQGTPYQLGEKMPILTHGYMVAVGILVIWAFYRGAEVGASVMDDLFTRRNDSLKGQFFPILNRTLKLLVIVIGLLTLAASFGVNIMGLVASLGIGGLAVALAAQDTLGNLFGSVAVLIDRPFQVGDIIKIGDKLEGTVEEIGFRSTKVRTLEHTLMVVPNKTMAMEIIENGSARRKRRVRMLVGLTYATRPEVMEKLLLKLRALLGNDGGIDQESVQVRFFEFGSSSLDVLVQYNTRDADFGVHLEVKERINFGIMREVAGCGLSMAFPTRTIELEGRLAEALVARGSSAPGGN
jgi:MscS family membrane protein